VGLNPTLTRYWTGLKQTNWFTTAKYVYQDGPRVTTRGKPSNGFNATGGGFPWNHWGTGEPNDASNGRCVASDKTKKFWKYDADGTTRVSDTDTTNNVFGWDDLACTTSLAIICVWSCGQPPPQPPQPRRLRPQRVPGAAQKLRRDAQGIRRRTTRSRLP
jgi:hypothetical protein